jgi:hypothetical protein
LYIDQDNHLLIILASDSILSYFQDLFSTIHYIEGVGDNDVGKSSIGYTFENTGYRVIRNVKLVKIIHLFLKKNSQKLFGEH